MTEGDFAYVKVGIINRGDAPVGDPVYVTFYREEVAPANIIPGEQVNTENIPIQKGDTGYVTVKLDMAAYPIVRVKVRVNDNGTMQLHQPECNDTNNETSITLLRQMHSDEMRKDATLLPVPPATPVRNNGTYPNPVSALYSDTIEYRITPRTGILVVPDEGYRFAGWSHDNYVSLRGERIAARTGIMHYDTLTVYGSVELHARFAPEQNPLHYHLHGGENPTANPPTSPSPPPTNPTTSSPAGQAQTATTRNRRSPSRTVPPANATTTPITYTAAAKPSKSRPSASEDKIWSSGSDLYIRTSKPGAIIRIYTPEGILHRQQTALTAGETRIKLPPGIYIVTLNSNLGQKVMIEE